MTKPHGGDSLIAIAAIGSASLSALVFQALGTIICAFLGALVAWSFNKFLRPRLDAWVDKRKGKSSIDSK